MIYLWYDIFMIWYIYDMTWYDMIWYGMVRYGMVWYDVVCYVFDIIYIYRAFELQTLTMLEFGTISWLQLTGSALQHQSRPIWRFGKTWGTWRCSGADYADSLILTPYTTPDGLFEHKWLCGMVFTGKKISTVYTSHSQSGKHQSIGFVGKHLQDFFLWNYEIWGFLRSIPLSPP